MHSMFFMLNKMLLLTNYLKLPLNYTDDQLKDIIWPSIKIFFAYYLKAYHEKQLK